MEEVIKPMFYWIWILCLAVAGFIFIFLYFNTAENSKETFMLITGIISIILIPVSMKLRKKNSEKKGIS